MHITTREFTNLAELRTLINSFTHLFAISPEVRITVVDDINRCAGTVADVLTGELIFFPANGLELVRIGTKYIDMRCSDTEVVRFAIDQTQVLDYKALFYLP